MKTLTVKDIRRGLKIGGFQLKRHTFCSLRDDVVCGGCVLSAAYCNAKNKSFKQLILNKMKREKRDFTDASYLIESDIQRWARKEFGQKYFDLIIGGFDAGSDYSRIINNLDEYIVGASSLSKAELKQIRLGARFIAYLNKIFDNGEI